MTVLGPPGIGKSRLAELPETARGEATVLAGRCLSYGEGITFWPVGEIVAQAAAIDPSDSVEVAEDKLLQVMGAGDDADVAAARVGELIGLSPLTAGTAESFWGVRVLLEALARRRPLAVVLAPSGHVERT